MRDGQLGDPRGGTPLLSPAGFHGAARLGTETRCKADLGIEDCRHVSGGLERKRTRHRLDRGGNAS